MVKEVLIDASYLRSACISAPYSRLSSRGRLGKALSDGRGHHLPFGVGMSEGREWGICSLVGNLLYIVHSTMYSTVIYAFWILSELKKLCNDDKNLTARTIDHPQQFVVDCNKSVPR